MKELQFPIKCLSYCASNYGTYDKINSYEFWVRGHLIRIVGDKPFSRGDMIWLDSIEYNDLKDEYVISIRVIDDEDYEEGLPILSLSISRIVYSVKDFDIEAKDGAEILKSIYIETDSSYSLAFITLLYGDGSIKCKSRSTNAMFDLDFRISWKQ